MKSIIWDSAALVELPQFRRRSGGWYDHFLQRERDGVVEGERASAGPGSVRVNAGSRSRFAEVALEQSVPERHMQIGPERAPECLDRGRKLERPGRLPLAGDCHRHALYLDARLDDVADFERSSKTLPITLLRFPAVAADQRAVREEVHCEVRRPDVAVRSLEQVVGECFGTLNLAERNEDLADTDERPRLAHMLAELMPDRVRLLEDRKRRSVVAGVIDEEPSERLECGCGFLPVAELLPTSHRVYQSHPALVDQSDARRQRAGCRQRSCQSPAVLVRSGDCRPQAGVTLGEVAAREPEPADGAGQFERGVRSGLREPIERSAQVVVVAVEPVRPFRLRFAPLLVGAFCKPRELLRVTHAKRRFLAGLGEALEPVLADRLEHEQTLVADRLEQAEVDE